MSTWSCIVGMCVQCLTFFTVWQQSGDLIYYIKLIKFRSLPYISSLINYALNICLSPCSLAYVKNTIL